MGPFTVSERVIGMCKSNIIGEGRFMLVDAPNSHLCSFHFTPDGSQHGTNYTEIRRATQTKKPKRVTIECAQGEKDFVFNTAERAELFVKVFNDVVEETAFLNRKGNVSPYWTKYAHKSTLWDIPRLERVVQVSKIGKLVKQF